MSDYGRGGGDGWLVLALLVAALMFCGCMIVAAIYS
jgi:hypothetical protein